MKSYLSFCDAVSLVPFPVTLITRYVAYLMSLGHDYGTTLNHLSSIKHIHKLLGQELKWNSDYRYKLLLRGAKLHLVIAVNVRHPQHCVCYSKSRIFSTEKILFKQLCGIFYKGPSILFCVNQI